MIIVITMAGLGSRFTKAGYSCPKFMIEAKGKTLFEWSMLSLVGYSEKVSRYVFVAQKQHNSRDFIVNKMKKYTESEVDIVEIDHLTDGQATTAYLGLQKCNEDEEVLIFNIDTFIEPNVLLYKDLNGDGHIPCFNAEGNHWSFVSGDDGVAYDVAEKKRISNNCSIGAYYFKTVKLFKTVYKSFCCSGLNNLSEKYIAPMYKYMIDKGYHVTYSIIDSRAVHVLGTPEELDCFIRANTNNY